MKKIFDLAAKFEAIAASRWPKLPSGPEARYLSEEATDVQVSEMASGGAEIEVSLNMLNDMANMAEFALAEKSPKLIYGSYEILGEFYELLAALKSGIKTIHLR